jgi:hypothetical protein
VESMKSLVTIPTGGEGRQSQSPNGYAWRVINRLHASQQEMLSKVRGTATPREIRDQGLFVKESPLFPLWFWPPLQTGLCNTSCILNP